MKDKDNLIKHLQSRLKALGEDIGPGLSGTVDYTTVFSATEDLSEQPECTERFNRRTNVSSRYSTANSSLSQQNNMTGSIDMIKTDQTSIECAASGHLLKGDKRLNSIERDGELQAELSCSFHSLKDKRKHSKEKSITEKIGHNTLVPTYKDKRDIVSATMNRNKKGDTQNQLIQQDGNDNHNKDEEVYNRKQYDDNQVCSTKNKGGDILLQLDQETTCISSSHKSEETPSSSHKPDNPPSEDEGTSSKQTNSKLKLPRQGKRRSRYKEHADSKKQRMSPNSDKNARLKGMGMMQNTETQVVGQSILVPETEMVTKHDDSYDDEDSSDILVVPESLAFDADCDRDDWLKEKVPVGKTPKTPTGESPRIFDDIKVCKHIPGTPYRNTGANFNQRKPSKSSNTSQLLGNRNGEENGSKENQSPKESLRQSTLTQAFSDRATEKSSAEEMKRKEEDDVAKAIHRSLQDGFQFEYASAALGGREDEEDNESSQENTLAFKESNQISNGNNSPHKKISTRNKRSLKLKERSPNLPEPILHSLDFNESALNIIKKDSFTPVKETKKKDVYIPKCVTQIKGDQKKHLTPKRTPEKIDLFTPQRIETVETKKKDLSIPKCITQFKGDQKKDLTPKTIPLSSLFAKKKSVVSPASDEQPRRSSAKDDIKLMKRSSKNDETIAPYLISDYPSVPMDSQDFSLPSLCGVLGTKHEAELSRDRIDNTDLGGFNEYVDDDDKDYTDTDEEDEETIAPSPQNSMLVSQLSQSMSLSSRSFQFKKIPKPLLTRTLDINEKNTSSLKNNSKGVPNSKPSSSGKGLNHHNNSVKCMDVDIIEEQNLFDSFDRLPSRHVEEYAHVQVVRKHSERQKLQGFSCKQCEDFYKNSGKSECEIQQQMQQCSRHRDKQRPPSTPEHFWSLGFADTCDDTAKDPTQAIAPRPRRRVKLAKKF